MVNPNVLGDAIVDVLQNSPHLGIIGLFVLLPTRGCRCDVLHTLGQVGQRSAIISHVIGDIGYGAATDRQESQEQCGPAIDGDSDIAISRPCYHSASWACRARRSDRAARAYCAAESGRPRARTCWTLRANGSSGSAGPGRAREPGRASCTGGAERVLRAALLAEFGRIVLSCDNKGTNAARRVDCPAADLILHSRRAVNGDGHAMV